MKHKKVIGSFVTVLILSILIMSFTIMLPLQESKSLGIHNCFVIRWEADRDANGNVIGVRAVVVGGHAVIHAEKGHRDDHEFTCW